MMLLFELLLFFYPSLVNSKYQLHLQYASHHRQYSVTLEPSAGYKQSSAAFRRVCCQKLETLISRAKSVKTNLNVGNIREKLRQIHDILADLENISFEVSIQISSHSLPKFVSHLVIPSIIHVIPVSCADIPTSL